jgi:hypothetical protein
MNRIKMTEAVGVLLDKTEVHFRFERSWLRARGLNPEANVDRLDIDSVRRLWRSLVPNGPRPARDRKSATYWFLGETRNNLAEFLFVQRLLHDNRIPEAISPVTFLPSKLRLQKRIAAIMIVVLVELRQRRKRGRANSPSRLVLYRGFARAYSLINSATPKPIAVFFSNDHLPEALGWSAACKISGVTRVYLQHAPVTAIFPPLDFEVAVLRDKLSLSIYERLGPVPRSTFVLAREPEQPAGSQPSADSGGVTICLYLSHSTVLNGLKLKELEAKLRLNPSVEEFLFVVHPRDLYVDRGGNQAFLEAAGWKRCWKPPEQPHIAITGNSGVAVELAKRLVKQTRYYPIDSLPADYHRLSELGITKSFELSELSGPFWEAIPDYPEHLLREYFGFSEESRATVAEQFLSKVLVTGWSGEKSFGLPDAPPQTENQR